MKLLSLFIFFVSCTVFGQNTDSIGSKTIIYNTIQAKKEKKLQPQQFTLYNKLIITANPDLIEGRIDSVFKFKRGKKMFVALDSSDYIFKKLIIKQHLYQTEKISKFQTYKKSQKETILATKMAGFKQPVFEYFAINLLSKSLYDKKIYFLENEYINPISELGLLKYQYNQLPKTSIGNRAVYVLQFSSLKKNKTNKLQGILYIDTQNFTIAKANFSISGIIKITANYDFKFDQENNNWISSQQDLIITKGKNKYPIKIFGETITFQGENADGKKFATDFVEISSKTLFLDPKINTFSKIERPENTIEINENAIKKKESFWFKPYSDSLDIRSKPTYISLDSLVQKRKIENKIQIGRKVIKGYYPVGFFDFDLRYILRYNNFEGFRLGLGGITNNKLSKNYKLEGYYAFGTKDGVFKGFVSNSFKVNKYSETWLGISYMDDVKEIASTSFEVDKRVFKIYDPRPFNISTFYNHKTWRSFVETKLIPRTESIFQVSNSNISPKFDYQFLNNGNLFTNFQVSLFTASLQWNPFSNYMQTPNGKIEINKKYPKFTFQFSKTVSGLWNNNFNFGKLDFRFDYQKKIFSNHKTMFLLEGGYASGDIPITHIYNHSPNNLTKETIIQRINFAGKDTFETMFFNEFFSNKYIFTQLEHQFPKLEISRKIKPVFSLVTRYGLGNLDNANNHKNIVIKKLNKGFMESGFELNNIFKGLGFVAFYRYGSNQLPKFEDNIAVKLSFQLDLGFNN